MRQMPESLTAHAGGGSGQTVATYVVAAEGVAAGIVIRALEREGMRVDGAWGPVTEPSQPEWSHLDLVVVVETDDEPHPDDWYTSLRAALPDAAITVVCSADRPRPQGLIWAGVDAIVFDPGADAIVGAAARLARSGYVVVPQALRAALEPPPLTSRERQILELVIEGCTNREIAERMFLAESTVKRHLSSTFRRLGVNSRREAAAAMLAADQGRGWTPPGL
jgi:DNA-binding NarL/FixJ family response regulator